MFFYEEEGSYLEKNHMETVITSNGVASAETYNIEISNSCIEMSPISDSIKNEDNIDNSMNSDSIKTDDNIDDLYIIDCDSIKNKTQNAIVLQV